MLSAPVTEDIRQFPTPISNILWKHIRTGILGKTVSDMKVCNSYKPGSENIKLFHAQTELSMNFKLLIYTEIAKINGNFEFNKVSY